MNRHEALQMLADLQRAEAKHTIKQAEDRLGFLSMQKPGAIAEYISLEKVSRAIDYLYPNAMKSTTIKGATE